MDTLTWIQILDEFVGVKVDKLGINPTILFQAIGKWYGTLGSLALLRKPV